MAATSDLELLRAHEPVLVCTEGELFLPTDVGAYVRNCSLWIEEPGGGERLLVPAGELTLDRLSRAEEEWPGRHKHLRFVQEETWGGGPPIQGDRALVIPRAVAWPPSVCSVGSSTS